MRLFFVDESGDAQMGTTQYLVIAGVILKCEDWPSISDGLSKIKSGYGITPQTEVKWRHTRHPGGHRNPLRILADGERELFAKEVLSLIWKCMSARVMASS